MNFVRNLVIAASVVSMNLGAVAMAKDVKLAKSEPNCEVNGKKKHVKDKAACEKKKGTWIEAASSATTPTSGSTQATTPAATPAPASTPAPAEQK
jgi:hypothetical protein